ncbi:MAG: iron-sulfur cluster carrier protein ApbC [Rhodanobacteraceae bacterium]|nr:iron-sulfur cluster carrier protein ApbC [Rhodanobacteraceae bacterium]
MSNLKSSAETLLATIIDPHTGQNLVESGIVKAVGADGDRVVVDLVVPYPAASWLAELGAQVKRTLEADAAIALATVSVSARVFSHKVQNDLTPLPNIRNIIAVASGKGGVGKSTTAANLALALQAEGAKVGILDADIYGPSQPRMMGVSGKPDSTDGKTIEAKIAHGVQVMSIGLLIDEDTPMIWRGPMVTQALTQLLSDTHWRDLDYLVIDLPPGTGDIHLSLCQKVPVSGAVIVTTPQDIALLDAKKALKMFEKVNVPVLGIVENMAIHVCSNCGHAEHIFGEGGGARMAAQYAVPVLGSLPLDIHIREQADSGTPTVVAMPDSDAANRYRAIARTTAARLSQQARNKKISFPNIVIQNT